MTAKNIIVFGTILAAIAVIMGAMGAHALKEVLSPQALESYLTGARYNMYHAIGLLAIAGLMNHLDIKWATLGVRLLIIGVILFSGSIYILSTQQLSGLSISKFMGPITPIGGLLLISGWIIITLSAIKKR